MQMVSVSIDKIMDTYLRELRFLTVNSAKSEANMDMRRTHLQGEQKTCSTALFIFKSNSTNLMCIIYQHMLFLSYEIEKFYLLFGVSFNIT